MCMHLEAQNTNVLLHCVVTYVLCCALQVFNVFDKGRVQQLEGELKTLYIVNCPSLVRFHGVYKSDEKVCVYFM
jgi:hypothetical protein